MKFRAILAALTLAAGLAVGCTATAGANPAATPSPVLRTTTVTPGPHDDGPHPPLLPPAGRRLAVPKARQVTVRPLAAGGFTVAGLDLHDGMVTSLPDGRVALYGTEYGCGYQWYVQDTPWCGFGVSTADSLAGPWSPPTLLFSPASTDPWTGTTWSVECGSSGQGCFNPRMIQRDTWGSADGVWILWYNSPLDYSRNHSNAYNAMGCTGPLGPCGPGAPGHGSYSKPGLSICAGNGDFSLIASGQPGQPPAIVCTMPGAAALNLEQLNQWGVGGTGVGLRAVAGVTDAEGPGGYWDDAAGLYVLTYSDPGCGYCAGTQTGYATTVNLYTPWVAPANVGFGSPANGRRTISANSCGGQPRTVSLVDGQPYQVGDLWTGARNETTAGVTLAPLTDLPSTGTPGDGGLWATPIGYTCATQPNQ